jgi:hypothetical protein
MVRAKVKLCRVSFPIFPSRRNLASSRRLVPRSLHAGLGKWLNTRHRKGSLEGALRFRLHRQTRRLPRLPSLLPRLTLHRGANTTTSTSSPSSARGLRARSGTNISRFGEFTMTSSDALPSTRATGQRGSNPRTTSASSVRRSRCSSSSELHPPVFSVYFATPLTVHARPAQFVPMPRLHHRHVRPY